MDSAAATLARVHNPLPVATGPLVVAINRASGASDKDEACRLIESVLKQGGREYRMEHPQRGENFAQLMERCAAEAAARGGVLVAAGGDGSVNAAAQAARKHDVPLGIIPLGTFNLYPRLHGIPTDTAEAARVLTEGVIKAADIGEVNGRVILNNASFGLYTQLIRQREQTKQRFGRHQLVAVISAIRSLLAGQRPFSIRLVTAGLESVKTTSMVFVACNSLQLESLGLNAALCARSGSLGVLVLRPTRLIDRLRLLLRTALRQLDEDHRLESFCSDGFEVHSARRVVQTVIDGEILSLRSPLAFRALPGALHLVVPARR